jgi:voltage-gated potassium channel
MSFTPPGQRRVKKLRNRLTQLFWAITFIVVLGTIGFRVIEGWSWLTSLYVVLQTVTTVGFGDFTPATTGGKLFSILLMVTGIGAVLYALTTSVQSVVESEILAAFGKRLRYRKMRHLEDHFIICGAGRVGSRIVRSMQQAGASFVVIERDPQKVAELADADMHVLVRDATLEDTLIEAGVKRARGLAACLPDDADNVYVVLTARDLNRDLHIVARAVEEQAEPKLIRAGASRVIAPTIIGGHRMAQALMKPAVADFIDSITAESLDLGFEQVDVAPSSILVGKKIRDSNIRSELNAVVIALRKADGSVVFHPDGDVVIEPNDLLIVIGPTESLSKLNKTAHGVL